VKLKIMPIAATIDARAAQTTVNALHASHRPAARRKLSTHQAFHPRTILSTGVLLNRRPFRSSKRVRSANSLCA
jgi:hypothetical protein